MKSDQLRDKQCPVAIGGGVHHARETAADHAVRVHATVEMNAPANTTVTAAPVLIDKLKCPAPSPLMVGGVRISRGVKPAYHKSKRTRLAGIDATAAMLTSRVGCAGVRHAHSRSQYINFHSPKPANRWDFPVVCFPPAKRPMAL